MFKKMDQDKIHIGIASIDDADKILKIQKAAFLGQARIYNNYQLPPLTQCLESIRSEFNEKTFLKVVLKDQIIASARFNVTEGHVTIDRVVVEPTYQNKGIGTTLLREIESRIPNAEAFYLFTGNKSERNIYLYEKMGYKAIKTQVTEQGVELLFMGKKP
jgi:ribosomal protein S18 acetylase RimI-like enzyme